MIKPVKCLIIDDEPLAREKLQAFVDKIPGWEIKGSLATAIDAYAILQLDQINLMFLDIKMPTISGVEFLASLKKPPLTIFTTAFEKYAMDGHELNVVDYLLKPIPFDRFLRTVERVNNLLDVNSNSNAEIKTKNFLFLHVDDQYIKINHEDILYFESMNDYVKVCTAGRDYLVSNTLKMFEEQLPANTFIRVHRSFIISIERIKGVQGNIVYLAEKDIPIGNFYKDAFFKIIKRN